MKEKKVYYGYIYRITNIKNGKVYVGKTTEKIYRRFKRHYYDSKRSDFKMSRAIKKYGIESFVIQQLHEVCCESHEELDKKLNELEISEIENNESYKKGYNSTIGGDGCVGKINTKIRQKKMLKGLELYLKDNINIKVDCYDSNGCYIKTYKSILESSRETKIARSTIKNCCDKKEIYNKSFIFTYEKVEKKIDINDFKIGIHHSNKPVAMYDEFGNFEKSYKSLVDASKENGINHIVIIKNCKGEFKRASNKQFRYIEDGKEIEKKVEVFNKNKFKNVSPIACYDYHGNFLKNYKTIKDASKELKISSPIISMVCSGRYKSAKGYKFRYLNESEREKLNE